MFLQNLSGGYGLWSCQDPAKPQQPCQITAHGSQQYSINSGLKYTPQHIQSASKDFFVAQLSQSTFLGSAP
jgi:hypothetical protein